MPRRKEIDTAQLLKMVKDGVAQADIMSKLGIKTITQLKTAILNAYMNDGTIPHLVGGRGGSKSGARNTAKVGKRGTIIIAKELVEAFGFATGDEFTVRQTKYGLQLRKAGSEEETGAEE